MPAADEHRRAGHQRSVTLACRPASASWSRTTRVRGDGPRGRARRRRRRGGRPDRLDGPAASAPAADTRWTSAGGPCCPGSSTPTRTWSSPGTAARSSPPGWPASRTGRRHPGHGRRDPRRLRRGAAGNLRRLAAEMLAPGHDHVRVQVRLRADRADEARALRLAAEVTPEVDLPRRARRAAPSSPPTAPATSTSCAGRCWTPARRTPAGSTCSASRRASVRRGRGPRGARAGPRRGPAAPACTATSSSPGPGVRLAVEVGRGERRPLHPPDRRRRGRARRCGLRWSRPCCPAWSSRTRSPYPDARRLLDAGGRVALATDCNPGSRLHVLDAVRDRARRARDADDPGGGGLGRDRGRRRGAAPDDIGHLRVGARADLIVLDAP